MKGSLSTVVLAIYFVAKVRWNDISLLDVILTDREHIDLDSEKKKLEIIFNKRIRI